MKHRVLECTQQAGDLMYVPSNWLHGLVNVENSIGVVRHAPECHDLDVDCHALIDQLDLQAFLIKYCPGRRSGSQQPVARASDSPSAHVVVLKVRTLSNR